MNTKIGPNSGREIPNPTLKEVNRFWAKVNCGGSPDICWLWMGRPSAGGYGAFGFNGRKFYAHKVAHRIMNGEVPDGRTVAHKCDNVACVNPNHLFLTDHLGNMRDRNAKGRANLPLGETHHNPKLTDAKVLEIRSKYVPVKYPTRRLAREYGVTQQVIWRIVNRQLWTHI